MDGDVVAREDLARIVVFAGVGRFGVGGEAVEQGVVGLVRDALEGGGEGAVWWGAAAHGAGEIVALLGGGRQDSMNGVCALSCDPDGVRYEEAHPEIEQAYLLSGSRYALALLVQTSWRAA